MIVLALTTPVSRVTISCSCVARFLSSIFSRHKIPLERACNRSVEIYLSFLIQVVCNMQPRSQALPSFPSLRFRTVKQERAWYFFSREWRQDRKDGRKGSPHFSVLQARESPKYWSFVMLFTTKKHVRNVFLCFSSTQSTYRQLCNKPLLLSPPFLSDRNSSGQNRFPLNILHIWAHQMYLPSR